MNVEGKADPVPAWQLYPGARRWRFLAILFLVSFCNYLDRHVMSVLIEPIKAEFQVSDAMMGLLTGFAFAAVYAVVGLPVARIADRGDRRLVLSISLAVWSLMTVLCGFARTYPQLALARMGVGIGEAGSIPPSQSLIADYFPPEQRTRALAIFMASAMFGYPAAFAIGAQIAAAHGWRMAFIALGTPGLLLAILAWLGLQEPRKTLGRGSATAAFEPLGATLKALARKRTFVLINVGMVLYFLVAYGAVTWLPSYMSRVLLLKLGEIGPLYGLVSGVSALAGTLTGGFITDRVARNDRRWLARTPGLILILCCPVYLAALSTANTTLFFAGAFIGNFGISASVPGMFSVLHAVCGSARRSMAVAVAFFFANLLGLGFGPLITGALSDRFSAVYGPVGLGWALMLAIAILLPCGIVICWSATSLERDTEA